MLILQRRTGESVVIGEDVRVTVVSVEGGRVRLAISAPPEVSILRSELVDARLANQDSAVEEAAPAELLGLLGGMSVSPHKKQEKPEKGETRHDE